MELGIARCVSRRAWHAERSLPFPLNHLLPYAGIPDMQVVSLLRLVTAPVITVTHRHRDDGDC